MSRENKPDLEFVELFADGGEQRAEGPDELVPAPRRRPGQSPRQPRWRIVAGLGVVAGLVVGGVVGFGVGRHTQPLASAAATSTAAASLSERASLSAGASTASSSDVFILVPSQDVQYNSGAGPCDRLATTSTDFSPSTGLVRAIGLHFPGIVVSGLSISRYVDDGEICSADATGTDQALQVEVSLRFFGIATDGSQTSTTSVLGRYTESATRNFFLERYSVSLEFSAQRAEQLPTPAALQGFIAEPLLAARA